MNKKKKDVMADMSVIDTWFNSAAVLVEEQKRMQLT
jgi:hypothetical protein